MQKLFTVILLSCSLSVIFFNNTSNKNYIDDIDCYTTFIKMNLNYTICASAIKLPDSCVYDIIDSLKIKVSKETNAYVELNSIYSNSDGEISEYFMEIMTELFYTNYSNLSKYLYSNRKIDQLHIALIEGLSMHISMSQEPNKERDLIKSKILHESTNIEIKEFMLQLEEKIDPKLFD